MNSSFAAAFLGLFAFPLICSTTSFSQPNRNLDHFEVRKWRDDLRYMSGEMRKWHKNLFHTIPQRQFDEEINTLDQAIPVLGKHQIIVEMQRIAAMIGDGHTNVAPTRDPKIGFRTYPLKLYFFGDGLYVRAATREFSPFVGARVVSIGNASVDQAYTAVRHLIGRDNEMGARYFASFLLSMPEVLHALGIVSNMDKATFTVDLQDQRTSIAVKPFGPAEMQAVDSDTSWMLPTDWIDARQNATRPTPLWLKDPRNKFWYEFLPASKTLYVQFNQVGNKADESVEAFSQRLLSFVDDNTVNRFVLDLRLNRGGNGELTRPLLLSIIKSRKIDQKGKLFVIVGRGTWSAAQFLAGELERYTNATFVGEPTGGKPNSYGDSHKITLPNSGITVRVSTLWWQEDERDTRQWIAPQISVDLTFDDYRANRDPALDAIVNYVPRKPLAVLLTEALAEGGLSETITKYREWQADLLNKYAYVEAELNALGYRLLTSNRIDEAIEIFKLNVEANPQSANVYDSLGEAYRAAGQNELSLKNYLKALDLNPRNVNAQEMLKRLQAK